MTLYPMTRLAPELDDLHVMVFPAIGPWCSDPRCGCCNGTVEVLIEREGDTDG